MNKSQLIDAIASKTGLTKVDSAKALNAVTSSISESMKKGERVSIPGFGSFNIVERRARTGRNPQTGKAIKIPAKNVVRFKAGSELSSKVS